jgi:hypothetical protein
MAAFVCKNRSNNSIPGRVMVNQASNCLIDGLVNAFNEGFDQDVLITASVDVQAQS